MSNYVWTPVSTFGIPVSQPGYWDGQSMSWKLRVTAAKDYVVYADLYALPEKNKTYTRSVALAMNIGNLEKSLILPFIDASFRLGATCTALSLKEQVAYKAWVIRRAGDGEKNGGGSFEQYFGSTYVKIVVSATPEKKSRLLINFMNEGKPGSVSWSKYCEVR